MANIEQDAQEFLSQSSQATATQPVESSSIESDAQEFLVQNQSQNQSPSATTGLESQFLGSPLSFTKRAALSFAGDNAENVLKRDYKFVEKLPNGKFAVGNDIRQLQPIDPEGVLNDLLGDLADVASWVAPTVLSTAGAVAAIPADISFGNPLPSMTLAANGMMLGELLNVHAGRSFGVRDNNPVKDKKDVESAGISGFVGQGAGIGAAKLMQSSAPILFGTLDKMRGSMPESIKNGFDYSFRKVLHVAAAIDEKATAIGQKVGFRNLLSPKNMSNGEITNITTDAIKNSKVAEERLGGLVDDAVLNLHSMTSGRPVIEVKPSFEAMTQHLKDMKLLHDGNFINKSYPNGADKSFFEKFLHELGARKQVKKIPVQDMFSKNVRTETVLRYVSPEDKIPFKSLVSLKREFASEYDKLSPRAQMVYSEFMGSLSGEANTLATQLGDTAYASANKGFYEFMGTKKMLRQAGMDLTNPIATNNFLSKVIDHPDIVQGELAKLDATIGGNMLDRATQWNAAQAFKVSNPNMLRLAAISGIIGGSFGGGDMSQRISRGVGFGVLGLGGLPSVLKSGEALSSMIFQAKKAKAISQASMLRKLMQPALSSVGAVATKESYSNNNQQNQ